MGRRIKSNFNRRFENKIIIFYTDRPLRASERRIQNESIFKAFSQVMAGSIGREPREAEIFGITSLEVELKRMAEKNKRGLQC